jgi:hypothetical protein
MSHENMIQERMRKLDNMTADFLANLSGVPGTRLSQAFRGLRQLDNEQVVLISKTLKEVEDLAESVAPIPVAFRNAKVIRAVLEEQRSGALTIDVKISANNWEKKEIEEAEEANEKRTKEGFQPHR